MQAGYISAPLHAVLCVGQGRRQLETEFVKYKE
jgi:hypothetical protein